MDPTSIKVFILEDDDHRVDLFKRAFLKGDILTIAQDYKRGCRMWSPPYDIVLLDHDLANADYQDQNRVEENGTAFAKFIQGSTKEEVTFIHSWNPDGAKRMYEILSVNGSPAVLMYPFGPKLLETLKKWRESL